VIGTEMSGGALSVNGPVKHATDVDARDVAAMHGDTDKTTTELVRDHEHPVAPKHDGLASKEVHAPEAVSGVADERQPRGSVPRVAERLVFGQHGVHDVLIKVNPERLRDNARNPWTVDARIDCDDDSGRFMTPAPLAWPGRMKSGAIACSHDYLWS